MRAALGVVLYAGLLAAHVVTLTMSETSTTAAELVSELLTVPFAASLHALLCVCYAVVMVRQDHAAYGHVLGSFKWRKIVRTVGPLAISHARQALRVHLRGIWCILWLVEVHHLVRALPTDQWEFAAPLSMITLVNGALQTIVCADLAVSFSAASRTLSWLLSGETWVDLAVSPVATLATIYAVREPRYALVVARFGYLRMLSLLEPRAYIAALRGLDEVSVLLVKTVVQLTVLVLMFAGAFLRGAAPAPTLALSFAARAPWPRRGSDRGWRPPCPPLHSGPLLLRRLGACRFLLRAGVGRAPAPAPPARARWLPTPAANARPRCHPVPG